MEATTLPTILPLILFLFLFLSFTTNGVSARLGISIVDQTPAVLDLFGNRLQKGEYYYLLPSIPLARLYSPAIIPGIYRKDTCWLQLQIEIFSYEVRGLSVKFSPVERNHDESIRESTDVNIKFSDELSSLCGGSSVLMAGAGALGDEFLSLGGAVDDRTSWFKIEKASKLRDGVYKLVSSSDPQVSRDVGTSTRADKSKRLVLADEPLPFVFSPLRRGPSASK